MNRASSTRIGTFTFALAALVVALNAEAAMIGDPTGFAVYSGGQISTQSGAEIEGSIGAASVWLGNNTEVEGSVYTGANLGGGQKVEVSGSLYVGAALSLGNKAKIGGTAWYGTTYSVGNNSTITGGLSELDAADAWSPGPLPDLDVLAPGVGSEWFANNSSYELAPGAYGGLSTGNNVTLDLVAGEYSFDSMWLAQNSDLNVDTSGGDVVIHVTGNFSTGSNVAITTSGGGSLTVLVGGSVWLAQNTTSQANFISVGSTIGLGAGAEVQGVLWAVGDISMGSNTKVYGAEGFAYGEIFGGGDEFVGGGASTMIPEPATAALLLAGLAMVLDRRPRKKR